MTDSAWFTRLVLYIQEVLHLSSTSSLVESCSPSELSVA